LVSKDHEGKVYPPYQVRPDRAMGLQYAQALGLSTDLDIPRHQALHGGQRYEWFAPVEWDEVLQVHVRIDRVLEKNSKAGPLWFVDASFDYHHAQSGVLAVREITRLIKRGAP
jgi:hydroxyacyl-ACP dehydratase HTD2-like protein with hotdog domain